MWSISELIPHREPMILIDRVLEAGDDFLVAEVVIRRRIPFFDGELGVPAWVGLEYMGQAIAALAGLRAKRAGLPMLPGLLIGCRRYSSRVHVFAPDRCLTVEVHETAGGRSLSTFAGTIRDGELLAESSISVYQGHASS
ncbi:MAG: 3-hydroxylacyl-ACP dehydratase [Gammaproteobacteria bacterium]